MVRVSTDGCNLPCQFDGLEEDSLHAREQSMGRFVICRDQQGAATASFGQRFFRMNCEPGERSKDKQDEADEHSEERKRNPRKQRDVQLQHDGLYNGGPVYTDHKIHLVCGYGGERGRAAKYKSSSQPGGGW